LGIGPQEWVLLGANLGRAIVYMGPIGRACATAPRRGPLAKLLWADLFEIVTMGIIMLWAMLPEIKSMMMMMMILRSALRDFASRAINSRRKRLCCDS